MRQLFPLFLIFSCLLTFLPGCEPKEDLVQTSGSLEFSTDSVKFDTVFTTITTVTKRLWVYNRNAGAVRVERISLATQTGAEPYQLIVNGDAGNAASNVLIRGKDSLQVLVKAVLGGNNINKPFLLTDQINFRTNGHDQHVQLVAYGQNAYFHNGETLLCNSVWRSDKPHVIYNSVLVNTGCTLRIMPGTRVYSHAGSGILVKGRVLVNASPDFVPGTGDTDTVKATNSNIVRFLGDRLEPFYNNIPGQWLGIQLQPGSTGNIIRYAEIRNASFGVLLYNPNNLSPQPNVTLDNTVIQNISGNNLSFGGGGNNFAGGGILSYSGTVTATNCLFANCGEYAVLGVGGGTYNFNFCTFANFTPAFRRETSSLTFTNEKATDGSKQPLTLNLLNSIVWGSFEDELFLKNNADYFATVRISNSLLRTKEYQATTDATGKPGLAAQGLANIVNVDPAFVSTPLTSSRFDYRLQATSPGTSPRRSAAPGSTVPPRDLLNLPRPNRNRTMPSLGAYEHQ